MDEIAAEHAKRGDVVDESRKGLHAVMTGLMENWERVKEEVRRPVNPPLGPCPACGRELVARTSRFGTRFAGCTGYPECRQTYSLPAEGKIEAAEGACETCGSPRVRLTPARRKGAAEPMPVERCIDPACPTNYVEPVPIGTCPNCSGRLMLIHNPKTGKRFVRCENYDREEEPCKTSYPVPQRGDIKPTGGVCEPCGSPKVVVETRRGPWEVCLDPDCTTKQATKKPRRAGAAQGPGQDGLEPGRLAPPMSYRGLLKNSDYRKLWVSQAISTTGDWLIIGLVIDLAAKLSGGSSPRWAHSCRSGSSRPWCSVR